MRLDDVITSPSVKRRVRDALFDKYARLRHIFHLMCAAKGSGPNNLDFSFMDTSRFIELCRASRMVDERNLPLTAVERIMSQVVRTGLQTAEENEKREQVRKLLLERQQRRENLLKAPRSRKKTGARGGKRKTDRTTMLTVKRDDGEEMKKKKQVGDGERDPDGDDGNGEEEEDEDKEGDGEDDDDDGDGAVAGDGAGGNSAHALSEKRSRKIRGSIRRGGRIISIIGVENTKPAREMKMDLGTPERLISRSEFFEILVRCAIAKFDASDPSNLELLMPRLMRPKAPDRGNVSSSSSSLAFSPSKRAGREKNSEKHSTALLTAAAAAAAEERKVKTLVGEDHRTVFLLENFVIPYGLRDARLLQMDFRAFLATSKSVQSLFDRFGKSLRAVFLKACHAAEVMRAKRNPFVPRHYLTPNVMFGPHFMGPKEDKGDEARRESTTQQQEQQLQQQDIAPPRNATQTFKEDMEALQSDCLDSPGFGTTPEALEHLFVKHQIIGPLLSHRNLHVACALSRDENADSPLLSFPCFLEVVARVAASIAVTTSQYHSSAASSVSLLPVPGQRNIAPSLLPPLSSTTSTSSSSSSLLPGTDDTKFDASRLVSGLGIPTGFVGEEEDVFRHVTMYDDMVWRSRKTRAKYMQEFRRLVTILCASEEGQNS